MLELAPTEKFTAPFPDPLAPELTMIQVTSLPAFQPQPGAAVTLIDPVPPPEVKDRELEETE